jgi:hypothetical protein
MGQVDIEVSTVCEMSHRMQLRNITVVEDPIYGDTNKAKSLLSVRKSEEEYF